MPEMALSGVRPSCFIMVFMTEMSDEMSQAMSWNMLLKSFSKASFTVSMVSSISRSGPATFSTSESCFMRST